MLYSGCIFYVVYLLVMMLSWAKLPFNLPVSGIPDRLCRNKCWATGFEFAKKRCKKKLKENFIFLR
jgi:hypothetical protein